MLRCQKFANVIVRKPRLHSLVMVRLCGTLVALLSTSNPGKYRWMRGISCRCSQPFSSGLLSFGAVRYAFMHKTFGGNKRHTRIESCRESRALYYHVQVWTWKAASTNDVDYCKSSGCRRLQRASRLSYTCMVSLSLLWACSVIVSQG